MAEQQANKGKQPGRYLYLYLALACFLGIVIIFLFDGYLGLYDSLSADNGNYPQQIPTEQWQSPDRFGGPYSMSIDQSGYLNFTYRIENRRFTSYSAEVVVTVTDAGGTATTIMRGDITAGAFGHGEVMWTLRGENLMPPGTSPETATIVNLAIQRGDVVRTITLYVNRSAAVMKPVPSGTG